MAKIDDTLFRQRQKFIKLEKMLTEYADRGGDPDDISFLVNMTKAMEQENAEILLSIMMENEKEAGSLALLILSKTANQDLVEKALKIMKRKEITLHARGKLHMLLVLLEEKFPGIAAQELNENVEYFTRVLSESLKSLDYYQLGLLWLDEFYGLSVKEKIPLLRKMLDSGSVNYLPVLSVEIGSPKVTVSRTVAKNIFKINHEDTLSMLESLPPIRDTATRLSVEDAINQLRQNKKKGNILPAERNGYRGRKYCAYYSYFPMLGIINIFYAKKTSPDIAPLLIVSIDRWERGIEFCHGDIMDGDYLDSDIIFDIFEDFDLGEMKETDRDYVAWLLRKAENLTIDRARPLPPEYLLMRKLITDVKPVKKDYGIQFGIDCQECGEPVSFRGKKEGMFIGPDMGLCHKCARQKRRCENCGKSFNIYTDYIFTRPDVHHVTTICSECYMNSQSKSSK